MILNEHILLFIFSLEIGAFFNGFVIISLMGKKIRKSEHLLETTSKS